MLRRLDKETRDAVARAESASDAVWVRRVQSGDTEAFRYLFERYRKRVFLLAMGVVGNEEDARDIAQEAFVRAFRNIATFAGTSAFYTWLYRIVMNLSIDHMRRSRRTRADEFAEDGTSEGSMALQDMAFGDRPPGIDPRRALSDRQLGERIGAALAQLSENHRTVLVLREIHGLSYEEMAEVMGCSKGTVMSRLFHARKNMQAQLVDLYDGRRQGEEADPDEQSAEYVAGVQRPSREP